jgi:RNA polymerase sigma-70 factor (ECF subfamily)
VDVRDLPPIPDPFRKAQELADRELVDRLLRGDGQAADKFVRLHQHLVMRELRRFRNLSPEDRDDLFQDIFAKLFEDECRILGQWKGNSNFVAYLRRIVRNICVDYLRSLKRAPSVEPIGEGDDEPVDDDGSTDPVRAAQLNELRKLMLQAIQRLAPPDREIVTLIMIEEMTYTAAAERLGITSNNAGVRISEAKKRLRKVVEQSNPELLLHFADEAP